MNTQRKRQAYRLLTIKLKAFIKYNPNFGKQKVKLYSDNPFKKIKKCKYYFDEATVPFVDYFEKVNDVRIFTTSHLAEVKTRATQQIDQISSFAQINNAIDNVHEDSSEDNNEESINNDGDNESNDSHTSSPSLEVSEEYEDDGDEENADNYDEEDEEEYNLNIIRSESMTSSEYEWEEQDTDSISLDYVV
jgi:hypothetical protein